MANIAISRVSSMMKHLHGAQAKLAKSKEKVTHAMREVVNGGLIAATAYGLGTLDGRYGGVTVGGAPAELILAGLAHTAGVFWSGAAGSEHMHSVGNGALAVWAANAARVRGRLHREAQGLDPIAPGVNLLSFKGAKKGLPEGTSMEGATKPKAKVSAGG